MNCLKITKLISEARERKLSFTEKIGLNAHLMTCSHCRNFKHNSEQISKLMKKFAEEK